MSVCPMAKVECLLGEPCIVRPLMGPPAGVLL